MQKVAVLGAGSWGTALAILLANNGLEVKLWGRNPSSVALIKESGKNEKYLPGIKLPSNIDLESNLSNAVLNSEFILIACASKGFSDLLDDLKNVFNSVNISDYENLKIVSATKGVEPLTGRLFENVVKEKFPNAKYALLSGPSFAIEVAQGLPTAVVIASKDINYAKELSKTFSSDLFRVYASDDMVGVQLGGVLKNVLAVATGISDGLGFGANARAALITRGLAELSKLGIALGMKVETLMGLSCCGDIILSCTDDKSRNRRFGLGLGQGFSVDEVLKQIGQVVEAKDNVKEILKVAKEYNIGLPIAEQVYQILEEKIKPIDAVKLLFSRDLKQE